MALSGSLSMKPNYAKAFRVIRAAFGLRQSDLAERLPVTASQLSLIEAGKRQPSLGLVDAFARTVGVPAALVMLLASSPGEIESQEDANVADLAKALLRALVAATPDQQESLDLGS